AVNSTATNARFGLSVLCFAVLTAALIVNVHFGTTARWLCYLMVGGSTVLAPVMMAMLEWGTVFIAIGFYFWLTVRWKRRRPRHLLASRLCERCLSPRATLADGTLSPVCTECGLPFAAEEPAR